MIIASLLCRLLQLSPVYVYVFFVFLLCPPVWVMPLLPGNAINYRSDDVCNGVCFLCVCVLSVTSDHTHTHSTNCLMWGGGGGL